MAAAVSADAFLAWAAGAGIGFDPRYPEADFLSLLPPRESAQCCADSHRAFHLSRHARHRHAHLERIFARIIASAANILANKAVIIAMSITKDVGLITNITPQYPIKITSHFHA